MQLQTLITNKNATEKIQELLQKHVEECLEEEEYEIEYSIEHERKATAYRIAEELNLFEREHPRKDPALRNLDTAQWRAFIYKLKAPKGQYVRDARGRFTFIYRVQIWNFQQPFYYRFDFSKYNDKYNHGKLLLNVQSGKLLADMGKDPYHQDLWIAPYVNRGADPMYIPRRKKLSGNAAKPLKVGTRTQRAYVGNLAAVRISQADGRVYPKTKENHTHRLVWWNNGKVKRMGRGRPSKADGYIFVTARDKTGPGHVWYKEQIMEIINGKLNGWIDNIW